MGKKLFVIHTHLLLFVFVFSPYYLFGKADYQHCPIVVVSDFFFILSFLL